MKKMILKSTLAVVAVTASCLGAWKAYDAYDYNDNSLLAENVEALTQASEISDKSWYQYLAYTHPCDGWGMKMYCSKLKNKNNDHCHFHCGRQISD